MPEPNNNGAKPNLALRIGLTLAAFAFAAAVWVLGFDPDPKRLWGGYSAVGTVAGLFATGFALAVAFVMSRSSGTRRRTIITIAAGLVTALCWFLVEVPALFGYDYAVPFQVTANPTWLALSRGVNKPDPELIHIHWPNSAYEADDVVGNLVQLGIPDPDTYTVSVQYDSNGFRNSAEIARADVVVIGDSFVEGAILPAEAIFPAQLATRLSRTVANLGQAAYGFRQERIVLDRFGLPLQPRVVVWAVFGGNDFRDVPTYEGMRREFGKATQRPPLMRRTFLRNAIMAVEDATHATAAPKAVMRRAPLRNGPGRFIYFSGPTAEPSPHEWQVGTSVLRDAATAARSAGAHLVLLYIPRKFTALTGLLDLPADSVLHEWKDVGLNAALGEWALAEGIPFVDTVPALRAAATRGESPYLFDDVHWNALGHEIAARELAPVVQRLLAEPREATN